MRRINSHPSIRLVGWRHADEGKKAACFSPTLSCLGVSFNLVPFTSGRTEVLNTSWGLLSYCVPLMKLQLQVVLTPRRPRA